MPGLVNFLYPLLFFDECYRQGRTGGDAQTAAEAQIRLECQRAVQQIPGTELAAIDTIATIYASRWIGCRDRMGCQQVGKHAES